MTALPLCHHMDISHGIVMPYTQGVDVGKGVPEKYVVSFPRVLKSVACLVDGFLAREHNLVILR